MTSTNHTRKSAASRIAADELFERANEQWDRGQLRSAFRLFLLGAKYGDASAQHNLGYFYDVGIGAKPNREAALFWYKRAFRQGYGVAASNIGTIYRDDKSAKKALLWFQHAIELGDIDANLEVAKIYMDQIGDISKAVPYLKRIIRAKSKDVFDESRVQAQGLLRAIQGKAVEK